MSFGIVCEPVVVLRLDRGDEIIYARQMLRKGRRRVIGFAVGNSIKDYQVFVKREAL